MGTLQVYARRSGSLTNPIPFQLQENQAGKLLKDRNLLITCPTWDQVRGRIHDTETGKDELLEIYRAIASLNVDLDGTPRSVTTAEGLKISTGGIRAITKRLKDLAPRVVPTIELVCERCGIRTSHPFSQSLA